MSLNICELLGFSTIGRHPVVGPASSPPHFLSPHPILPCNTVFIIPRVCSPHIVEAFHLLISGGNSEHPIYGQAEHTGRVHSSRTLHLSTKSLPRAAVQHCLNYRYRAGCSRERD